MKADTLAPGAVAAAPVCAHFAAGWSEAAAPTATSSARPSTHDGGSRAPHAKRARMDGCSDTGSLSSDREGAATVYVAGDEAAAVSSSSATDFTGSSSYHGAAFSAADAMTAVPVGHHAQVRTPRQLAAMPVPPHGFPMDSCIRRVDLVDFVSFHPATVTLATAGPAGLRSTHYAGARRGIEPRQCGVGA